MSGEKRAEERRARLKDAIAEQGLASLVRKLIEGGLTLSFPKVETEGILTSAPVNILIGRHTPEGVPLFYNTPVSEDLVKSDKDLALAIGIALEGFYSYEALAIEELGKRKSIAGNGHGRIILPGE